MLRDFKKTCCVKGFTLIELLVVIGIISVLIGILVPGMRGLKMRADALNQKAFIRNIEIGLELFREENGDYPESEAVEDTEAGDKWVTGAQHLAEAMVGRDERGFDPKTKWHDPDEPDDIYDSSTATGDDSMARRQPLYVEIKKTCVATLERVFSSTALDGSEILTGDPTVTELTGTKKAPFMMDVFDRAIDMPDLKRSGSPIVYFKANSTSRLHKADPAFQEDTSSWIYDFDDNEMVFKLPFIMEYDEYPYHVYAEIDEQRDGRAKFYEAITNKNASYPKPHNPNTFILMSAGWDGVFGTKDDVTNF